MGWALVIQLPSLRVEDRARKIVSLFVDVRAACQLYHDFGVDWVVGGGKDSNMISSTSYLSKH